MSPHTLEFTALRQSEALPGLLAALKDNIETQLNLTDYHGELKATLVSTNLVQRLCLATGLGLEGKRTREALDAVSLSETA